jgi:topoisomerase-4 subunit B
MAPETRRLIQLTVEAADETERLLDMLLAKKRAAERRAWLEHNGNTSRRSERASHARDAT